MITCDYAMSGRAYGSIAVFPVETFWQRPFDLRAKQGSSVIANRSEQWEEYFAYDQISEFRDLPSDWDGYGAKPVHTRTLKNALGAVEALSDVAIWADKYPNPNGTISFEWNSPFGAAHLEIGRTKYSFYVKPEAGEPTYANGNAYQIDTSLAELIISILFPSQYSSKTISNIDFARL